MAYFDITHRVFSAIQNRGGLGDYIISKMLCNQMDPNKPYEIIDLEEEQVMRVMQESENEDAEVQQEETV